MTCELNTWESDGVLALTPSATAEAERGALSVEIDDFRKSVEIPAGEQPKPKVVRREGGYDIVAPPPSEQKKGSLFRFLRRG